MLENAKQEIRSIQHSKLKAAAVSVKNEVMEMIDKVAKRKGRLDLPIVSGKHLRRISDSTARHYLTGKMMWNCNKAGKGRLTEKRDIDTIKKSFIG